MPRKELCLAFTLPTGQSFRWRKTGEDMYTGVVHQRVVRYWLCIAPRKASCPVLPQNAASQGLSTETASTGMTRVQPTNMLNLPISAPQVMGVISQDKGEAVTHIRGVTVLRLARRFK